MYLRKGTTSITILSIKLARLQAQESCSLLDAAPSTNTAIVDHCLTYQLQTSSHLLTVCHDCLLEIGNCFVLWDHHLTNARHLGQ